MLPFTRGNSKDRKVMICLDFTILARRLGHEGNPHSWFLPFASEHFGFRELGEVLGASCLISSKIDLGALGGGGIQVI